MNIGLYFGSFNPVHIGHLIIANHIVEHTSLEQVWFVVTPQNPFKPSNVLLNEYNRLHLVNVAIEGNDKLRSSDVEFKLPRPSYTIDTLTYLHEKYPSHSFSVIMGSDSFQNLPKWKNYALLARDYKFIVYQRPGFIVPADVQGINYTIVNAPMLDISATAIRNTIKEGKSIRYVVPERVRSEIEDNGYYK